MTARISSPRPAAELLESNLRFFDPLWAAVRLVEPERFNTWPLVSSLIRSRQRRLEVAPGLRPRLPIEGTTFLDLSPSAIDKLTLRGAHALTGGIASLPFADRMFDLVCALDVVEHVRDDEQAFAELSRVAASGATLLLSVPLHPERWTRFDDLVGHGRRYRPAELVTQLARHGFQVLRSAPYGMEPAARWLVDLGCWFLEHQRRVALWFYVHLLMPLGLWLQSELALEHGLIGTDHVGEILLVCEKE